MIALLMAAMVISLTACGGNARQGGNTASDTLERDESPVPTGEPESASAAIYGTVCFRHADIFSYMFVKAEFVFFDYEKSAALVFVEHIAMMGTWIFAGYYVQKGIGRLAAGNRKKEKGRIA